MDQTMNYIWCVYFWDIQKLSDLQAKFVAIHSIGRF